MSAGSFIAYRRNVRTTPPDEAAVAIRSKGCVVLNRAALGLVTALLGVRPPSLQLLYSPTGHTLGIRGQVKLGPDYFKVFNGQSLGSSYTVQTFASSFFDRFGLNGGNVDLEVWCPAYVPDGADFLHVPLARPTNLS